MPFFTQKRPVFQTCKKAVCLHTFYFMRFSVLTRFFNKAFTGRPVPVLVCKGSIKPAPRAPGRPGTMPSPARKICRACHGRHTSTLTASAPVPMIDR